MAKNNPSKPISPPRALERIQYLCAQQEKCTHDLVQKLKQWGLSQVDIDKIISKLITDGFVNDSRFARLYVREKSRINRWGPIKLRAMLASKGIPTEIIDQALEELSDPGYIANLLELLKKKMSQIKSTNRFDLRNKLIRFGVSRGFPLNDVIYQVNQILGSDE